MEPTRGNAVRMIVVGYDGSPASEAALRWAVAIEGRAGDLVHTITVHPRDDLLPGTSFALQPRGRWPVNAHAGRSGGSSGVASARTPTTVSVSSLDSYGDAATELIAASAWADLLVLGAHHHGVMGMSLLGRIPRRCVRYAHCPVVVIPPEVAAGLVSTAG